MRGKKDTLAKWLHQTGLLELLKMGGQSALIGINYHRVWADHEKKNTLFDDEVFGPTQSELNQQFKWLSKNVDVVSEQDLLDITSGVVKSPGRATFISFDDGYLDNYTLAYPLLKSYDLSAFFFIPTLGIEQRSLGWWDLVAYLLKQTHQEKVIFQGKTLVPGSQGKSAVHYVLRFIYTHGNNVDQWLKELSAVCHVPLPHAGIQREELMKWKHLKELSEDGMAIGSHTHTHRILSSLDLDTQKQELTLSKQILEERLGRKIHSVAYPVGGYDYFSRDTKKLATACGYKLAFSFLTGINHWQTLDVMDVKRISVSNYFPRFVGTMRMPGLFCDSL